MQVGIQCESGMQPRYAHRGDAGCDLKAAEAFDIKPGKRKLVPCGIRVAIPENHVGYVVPRSGLALKYGVTVLNSPGIIDSGYRGVVHALLINHGDETFHANKGDRIAQFFIDKIPTIEWVPEKLDDTERGEGGFGSSGVE